MHAAEGILTARGGMTVARRRRGTRHGEVLRRRLRPARHRLRRRALRRSTGGRVAIAGDRITLDGGTGEVFAGTVPTISPELGADFELLMKLGRRVATHAEVRTNADTPQDDARSPGTRRRGHRPLPHRAHVLREGAHRDRARDDPVERRRRRAKEGPREAAARSRSSDFSASSPAMAGLPVTIRLLDPPLHEFLPTTTTPRDQARAGAWDIGVKPAELRKTRRLPARTNPMLGHRGCRLGITYPEIYAMQVRAIVRSALRAAPRRRSCLPRDHDPTGRLRLGAARPCAAKCSSATIEARTAGRYGMRRSAADRDHDRVAASGAGRGPRSRRARRLLLVRHQRPDADDTRLLSRDDAAKFLPVYIDRGLLPGDPFVSIDEGWRRPADRDRRRASGRVHLCRFEDRHLRRARRRSPFGRVRRGDRPRLRVLLAVPGTDRPPRSRPRGPSQGLKNPAPRHASGPSESWRIVISNSRTGHSSESTDRAWCPSPCGT